MSWSRLRMREPIRYVSVFLEFLGCKFIVDTRMLSMVIVDAVGYFTNASSLEEHNGTLATLDGYFPANQSLLSLRPIRLSIQVVLPSPGRRARIRRVQSRTRHPFHSRLSTLPDIRAEVQYHAPCINILRRGRHVARTQVQNSDTCGAVTRGSCNGVPDGVDGKLGEGWGGDERDLRLLGRADGFGDQQERDEGRSSVGVAVTVRGRGVPLVVP